MFSNEVALVLIAAGAGSVCTIITKFVYDYWNKDKTPVPVKSKSNGMFNQDLCNFKHEKIGQDITYLEEADRQTTSCLNHVKKQVQSIEIANERHEEQLRHGSKRMDRIESALKDIDTKTENMNSGVEKLLVKFDLKS